jgi:hypothetical protein
MQGQEQGDCANGFFLIKKYFLAEEDEIPEDEKQNFKAFRSRISVNNCK